MTLRLNRLIKITLAMLLAVATACGGSGGDNAKTPPAQSCATPADNVVESNRTYTLMVSTTYCATVYFDADLRTRQTLVADIESILNDVHDTLAVNRLRVLVDTDAAAMDPIRGVGGSVLQGNSIRLSVDPVVAQQFSLAYTLAREAHRNRRMQDAPFAGTLLQSLVSEGLAIVFGIEIAGSAALPEHLPALPDGIDREAVTALAMQQLDSETYEYEQWFQAPTAGATGTGYLLGYEMVERYLDQHPGSTAAHAYAVDATEFAPYIVAIDSADPVHLLKSVQRVRTTDVIGQIEVDALERQAALYRGDYFLEGLTHRKTVALTFDDGPSVFTTQVLDLLAAHQIKATFFVVGQNLRANQQIALSALQAGHTLANHTLQHRYNSGRAPEEFWLNSVDATNAIFEEVLGFRPRLFRPSYGEISDLQVEYLSARNMKVILWSIDTRDWNTDFVGVEDIVSAANDNLHEEAIILMHDAGGNRQNTVNALEAIINHYRDNGYEFVTVDKMLGVSVGL